MATEADTEASQAMNKLLTDALEADYVMVRDVSGGCGSMYQVLVVSNKFEGVSLVKQHRMVKEALKAEIADMHGLTVRTMTPEKFEAAKAAQGGK